MTAKGAKVRWWTPSQERELARLRAEGRPVAEIARLLGRTPRAIWQQVKRNPGLYPRRSRLDDYYDALQVVHTLAEVAGRMGVSVRTVERAKSRLRERGLCVGPARKSPKVTNHHPRSTSMHRTCPFRGCRIPLSDDKFACAYHWRQLTPRQKQTVDKAYEDYLIDAIDVVRLRAIQQEVLDANQGVSRVTPRVADIPGQIIFGEEES